jgi:hypothetical protein
MLIVDVSCLSHSNSPGIAPKFTISLAEGILNFHDPLAGVFATLRISREVQATLKYIAIGAVL